MNMCPSVKVEYLWIMRLQVVVFITTFVLFCRYRFFTILICSAIILRYHPPKAKTKRKMNTIGNTNRSPHLFSSHGVPCMAQAQAI